MTRLFFTVIFIAASCAFAFGQSPLNEQNFRVFDGKGNPATIEQIVKAIGEYDAVFLGEQHDDAVGHAIQLEIFNQAIAQYSQHRKVALSLEMFERDVQVVLNEYLTGLISEQHFLSSSRPWGNYKTDYRPLVELAREKKLDVIAANAPRRYVNMVSRNGRNSLNALSKEAKAWLAPLPYGVPSDVYAKKFKALMGPSPEAQMGIDKILASQSLWDATMANSVAKYLKSNKRSLVVHLNGGFHTESHLGLIEHLLKYRPKAKVMVVTIRYEDDFKTFDKSKHTDLGDYVILTAPKAKAQGMIREILQRMESHHHALKSLRADVTMVRYNSQIKESDTYVGSISYLPKTGRRPMYVRVDWTKPVEEQIVVIDDNYELYRPRLNQVIVGKIVDIGALSFMRMSKAELTTNYIITYLGEDQISGGVKTWHLEVTPKTAINYKSAEIWVDGDGMPRQARVNEKNGDTTTVLISSIQKNIPLKGEIFDLRYPKTVKEIKP